MKLRNKKTGEVFGGYSVSVNWLGENDHEYHSLAGLNEDWEDAPSSVWYITHDGSIHSADIGNSWAREKNIGNYFETREEAEKALEKLKAWKRLKDKGFRFILDEETEMPMFIYSGANGEKCITNAEESKQCRSDIKLLCEGEEQ